VVAVSEAAVIPLTTGPLAAGKREQTKLANRQAILDAARAVFGEMGYEAASVRDIIRRTGLSVGAFYNYYRSKEEVYQALADDGARRFRLILRAESERSEDFEGFLRRALYAFLSFQVTEQEAWQTQRPPGEQHHPHVRVDTPEMQSVFEEVKGLIARRIDAGGAPRVDADYLAAACIGIARELCDRMLERRPIDVEAATDFALAMIKGGIAALPRLKD
jgi:AcrR family transcriptional regulator